MIWRLLGIVAGGGAVIGLAAWYGISAIGHQIASAAWVLPFTTAGLFFQLALSAAAWRVSVGHPVPRLSRYFRIRWIREAANTLLPVAQLGGTILGIHLLVRRGLSVKLATAGTVLDVVVETVTQFVFIMAGFGALAMMDWSRANTPWIRWAMIAMGVSVLGLVLALRGGMLHALEYLATRFGRFVPGLSLDAVRGLHQELMRLNRDRASLLRASALHLLPYFLNVGETWLILTVIGRPTSFGEALVIESLGLASRSVGFAVPAGLGVQEAGLILVGQLLGVPPETAIALSMVKRARELIVGIPGLIAWQWSEGRRLVGRTKARAMAVSLDPVPPP